MRIELNNRGNLRNLQTFIASINMSLTEELTVVMKNKRIIAHPAHLALIAALATEVGSGRVTISGEIPLHLRDMGLDNFTTPVEYSDAAKKEPAGRYIPISIIHTSADQSRFIADMIPLLHLSEESATIVKYIIGELVRNVLEHSVSSYGAIVAARYYPKTNRISIGICDTGIGLRKSLQEYWHPRTDIEAVHLALTPGITGTTKREGGSSENAGAGLFFIKSIAKIARNYFAIYSGSAAYTLLKHDKRVKTVPRLFADPTMDPNASTNNAPRFNGTLVAVDITLNETPEFKKLLSNISEVYDKAIRERKRMKYKEPRFV